MPAKKPPADKLKKITIRLKPPEIDKMRETHGSVHAWSRESAEAFMAAQKRRKK